MLMCRKSNDAIRTTFILCTIQWYAMYVRFCLWCSFRCTKYKFNSISKIERGILHFHLHRTFNSFEHKIKQNKKHRFFLGFLFSNFFRGSCYACSATTSNYTNRAKTNGNIKATNRKTTRRRRRWEKLFPSFSLLAS